MVDALKLPNQAPRGSGEEVCKKCVAWCCPDGKQHLFCWPILAISGQSLASNGPVVHTDGEVKDAVTTPIPGFKVYHSTSPVHRICLNESNNPSSVYVGCDHAPQSSIPWISSTGVI
ncbi:hypothetical protein TNCV_1675721 [Trichonephila clavipes]|nr:hypothetical protein TNCV_1675721 [Trichonephila clavipes]